MEPQGQCDDRYAGVAEEFERNGVERNELGASVCVTVGGETVVDLWGGWVDPDRTRAWDKDTLTVIMSCTKGPTALCAHLLASSAGSSTSTRRSRRTGRSSPPTASRECSSATS